ncbi:protein MOR1 [Tanacetum coccineum]
MPELAHGLLYIPKLGVQCTLQYPLARAEMTLESRLGFLIQQDTITHLKSAALKEPLEDVMPAVLSVVEAECEKNPFEGEAAAPKKTVMASDSVSSVFGGDEHCTIIDIGDYAQMRFESIEAVKIVEEANKRIQPTGTVELFGALRARLYDSNQNLIMATLTSISGLPSAMGPAIQKSSKGIVSDIVKCIGDNNKHMGECTLATFDSWVASTDLDKVQYITPSMNPSMTDAKLGADGRTDLFDGLSKQLAIQLRPKIGKSKRMDARTFQTLAAAKMLTPTGPTGQTHWGDSMANNPMPAAHFADVQLKVKRLTDADQSMKATSKIEKSNRYGSKPESRAVSSFVSFLNFKRGVSAKGSKAESIMSVQDKSGPVGSRLAFTPTEPQRGSHLMPQPSVIGPTDWNEATPTFVEGMKVICQEFKAISKDLEVHLVDDLITDADRLVSCLAAKVLQKYRLLLLKYLLVMAWRSKILILLLEFIHSTLKKGFNHVEAKGFEFLAPTTRRNSMRVMQAMQLKKPVLLEASPGVGKTSLVLALGKFSGHSGLRINLSEQVIAEYFRRRNSWPKTNV